MGNNRVSRGVRRLILLPIVVVFFVTSSAVSRSRRDVATEVVPSSTDVSFWRSLLPTCNRSLVPPPVDVNDDGQFPPDPFSLEDRQKGAVVLHMAGLIYMFVSLAIVCDEFFVPSLDVLTEKLSLSDDVAGATFMAAGGSAPEFFTSVIGVFIAQNNVGIGTIVGSATFNILCVLAFCTLFSKTVLDLTWWPLFRDVSIYMIALAMLVFFFIDEQISWPEALAMFLVYVLYCTIMKFNMQLERLVKGEEEILPELPIEPVEAQKLDVHINRDGVSVTRPVDRMDSIRRRSSSSRRQSVPILHSGTMFRNGIMQLMNNTLDQLPEDSEEEDSSRRSNPATMTRNSDASHLPATSATERRSSQIEEIKSLLEEKEEQPLDMTWPDKWQKKLTYVLLAPVLVPMWVTIPDVRRTTSRHLYPATFVISILWIAFFSYLMVWWANTIGETFVIPTEVIGLTILAAGTSIPDLITSVIVARKGLGDMAVSSSVGSNIFDVCVGLPVPWLLYFGMEFFADPSRSPMPISVSSKGLLCSVGMLFIMLIVLVGAIFLSRWKMNKVFGIVMIISYVFFCIFSVALETDRLVCPLNIC
ncbi:unnamed protein product [Caenorhabditis auriculariae]|uniref:Sodium/calcium exchanger membrane region domain-containing protein n=1 Tax=Caenorhabditis auriculariae TaxID=2777116 RepID=A0A8S1GNH1_9PELO|nr:unnamed protein product [Caenorhabditis auriculariae]